MYVLRIFPEFTSQLKWLRVFYQKHLCCVVTLRHPLSRFTQGVISNEKYPKITLILQSVSTVLRIIGLVHGPHGHRWPQLRQDALAERWDETEGRWGLGERKRRGFWKLRLQQVFLLSVHEWTSSLSLSPSWRRDGEAQPGSIVTTHQLLCHSHFPHVSVTMCSHNRAVALPSIPLNLSLTSVSLTQHLPCALFHMTRGRRLGLSNLLTLSSRCLQNQRPVSVRGGVVRVEYCPVSGLDSLCLCR